MARRTGCQDLALEQVERADPLDHDPHVMGDAEDVIQVGPGEGLDRQDVLAVPGRGLLITERQIRTFEFSGASGLLPGDMNPGMLAQREYIGAPAGLSMDGGVFPDEA